MDDKQKIKLSSSVNKTNKALIVMIALLVSGFLGNLLFLLLVKGEAKTILLTKNELIELEKQEQIIQSSQELYRTYQSEIEVISSVFPDEESVTLFIQLLEKQLRTVSDTYTLKFNSQLPVKEKEKLYLPLTIIMRTDLSRLSRFFEELEKMPYMTQLVSISAKTPDGFTKTGEVSLVLKVYVQNPFTTQ